MIIGREVWSTLTLCIGAGYWHYTVQGQGLALLALGLGQDFDALALIGSRAKTSDLAPTCYESYDFHCYPSPDFSPFFSLVHLLHIL